MPTHLIERCYKHVTYVHDGCGKQSKVVYSLNHDIMASLPLDSHPELLKSYLVSAVEQCKGALVCLHTSFKGAKTLHIYVHYGCGSQSKVVVSFGSDSTGSVSSENRSVPSSVTSTQKM